METYPEADILVYAVWFDVLSGDDRSRWNSDLLDDPRVIEYWDDTQTIGRWFANQDSLNQKVIGPVAWDIFYLFGPDAQWTSVPSPLISSGKTILGEREHLEATIRPLIEFG